jgi:hypothetical protein
MRQTQAKEKNEKEEKILHERETKGNEEGV